MVDTQNEMKFVFVLNMFIKMNDKYEKYKVDSDHL